MNQRFSMMKQPGGYSSIHKHVLAYPTPIHLSFLWGMGPMAGIAFVMQVFSGFFISFQHTAHVVLAFACVETFMRDLAGGWLIRTMHSTGASMLLVMVHLHVFRGIYHASFVIPREWVRFLGVVLLVLLMGTAFSGYVLPWGQMAFWGATVISSIASAIPVVGEPLVPWLWGGFSVSNPTLTRFYSMHHLLPGFIGGASLMHLASLHQYGSNNPLGIWSMDKKASYPYFYVKDLLGLVAWAGLLLLLVCFDPSLMLHPDNYSKANPMPTPHHIVPEWYFLPLHSVLRSLPDKAGGVAALATVFLVLFSISGFPPHDVRSSRLRPLTQFLFWFLLADLLMLGWIGTLPVDDPYVSIGQLNPLAFLFICYATSLPRLLSKRLFMK